MAAAHLVGAQAAAMQAAASNEGAGPAMAFMGMNMAGTAGGMNAQNLFQMGQQQPQPQQQQYAPMQQQPQAPQQPPPQQAPAAAGWACACGHTGNAGKFCAECGQPPPKADGWACSCGTVNKGKFCMECAKPKPAGIPQFKCDKCGWEPEDKTKPPKFCPECGDPFDDGDLV
jgi:membrane protease subunit (stomatin/prohibitin family)